MSLLMISSLIVAFHSNALQQASPVQPQSTDNGQAVIAATKTTDKEFIRLRETFDRLSRAINRQGGMKPSDRATIETLCEKTRQFNEAHPNYQAGLAQEIQLSLWLGKNTRVNELTEKLWRTAPDNRKLGDYWLEMNKKNGSSDDVLDTYEKLNTAYPADPQLRKQWIEYGYKLGDKNQINEILNRLMATEARDDTTFLEMRLNTLNSINEYRQVHRWLADHQAKDSKLTPGMLLAELDAFQAEDQYPEALESYAKIKALQDQIDDQSQQRKIRSIEDKLNRSAELWTTEQARRSEEEAEDNNPQILFITNKGRIVLELFEDDAPNTTANFIELVEDGFYNQNKFNRLTPNGQIFAGAPTPDEEAWLTGDDRWGARYRIPDELGRPMFSGSLGMYSRSTPVNESADSTSSQFFLASKRLPGRDQFHPIFGRIIDGLDVARSLNRGDTIESAMVLSKRDHEYEVTKIYTNMNFTKDGPIKGIKPKQLFDVEPLNKTTPTTLTPTTLTPTTP